MSFDTNMVISKPLVISGLGGSGTRVVAEITRQLGWYLGDDLNSANDNLLFTLLFKRPHWYRRARNESGSIETAMSVFSRVMHGRALEYGDWRVFFPAIRDMMRHGHDHIGPHHDAWIKRVANDLLWPLLRIAKLHGQHLGKTERWGWKEPNSHVYLEHLAHQFPNMRYIHVIRHGLDMAFSRNQAQLYNWGSLYNVNAIPNADPATLACLALEYWLAANTHAIKLARQLLGQRFLLINYDVLCANQKPVTRELCAFLGYDCAEEEVARLSTIPRTPGSSGRYRQHDLGIFSPEQLEAVHQLGFPVLTSAETPGPA